MFATKLTEKKIPDSHNAKEYYQSFLRKKRLKVNEVIKNSYSTTKTYRKPKYYGYKSRHYRISRNFL